MADLIIKLTSPQRLRLVGVVCALGWLVTFVVHDVSADKLIDAKGNAVGRDFLAFYAAGTLVKDGRGQSLYASDAQIEAQAQLIAPETQKGFYYYINPASVAVVYSIFARLPYLPAMCLHAGIMATLFVGGLWVLRPHIPFLARYWTTVVLLSISWFPVAHTITAGQNAPLSFFLLCSAYAATVRQKQWIAGLALGVLLFKPQYAIPFIGLLLLRGQFLVVGISIAIGVCHYSIGGWCCGWDWPAAMGETWDAILRQRGYYHEVLNPVQGPTHISFFEVVDYSVLLSLEQAHAHPGLISGVKIATHGLIALLVLYVVWLWRTANPTSGHFGPYWAVAVAASLLISLHTQYYAVVLLIIPLLVIFDELQKRSQAVGPLVRLVLMMIYLCYPFLFILRIAEIIQFQPGFLIPVWIFAWSATFVGETGECGAGRS